jgi:hypothetical protein
MINCAQNLFMDRLLTFGVAFISDMLYGRAGHERAFRRSSMNNARTSGWQDGVIFFELIIDNNSVSLSINI